MNGASRNDSRGFLAIFNGFSTEPPRVRARCGFVAGEIRRRCVSTSLRATRVIHESKLERERTVSSSPYRSTIARRASLVPIDDLEVTIRETRYGIIAFHRYLNAIAENKVGREWISHACFTVLRSWHRLTLSILFYATFDLFGFRAHLRSSLASAPLSHVLVRCIAAGLGREE